MGHHTDLKPPVPGAGAARPERTPVMLDDLSPRTRWVGRAEIEVDCDTVVRGLLSHDGDSVRFSSFQGRLEWAAPMSSLLVGPDELSVRIGSMRYRIGGIHPLGGTPPARLARSADIAHFGRPTYGFLATLGLDV